MGAVKHEPMDASPIGHSGHRWMRRDWFFTAGTDKSLPKQETEASEALTVPVDAVVCSIIIPQYTKHHLTIACIESLLEYVVPSVSCEIIVIDDASPDGAAYFVKNHFGDRIDVFQNATNLKFAGSCNQGAALARGKYLLFLNNDTLSFSDWLSPMIEAIESNPRIGVVGAKLLYPDGRIQHAGFRWMARGAFPIYAEHWYVGEPRNFKEACRSGTVDGVTGACMLLPKTLFDDVGAMDTRYDMGAEDVDLVLKVADAGYEVWYESRAELIHYESATRAGTHFSQKAFENMVRLNQTWAGTWGDRLRLSLSRTDPGDRPLTFALVAQSNLVRIWMFLRWMADQARPGDVVYWVDLGSQDGSYEILSSASARFPWIKPAVVSSESQGQDRLGEFEVYIKTQTPFPWIWWESALGPVPCRDLDRARTALFSRPLDGRLFVTDLQN